MIIQKFFFGDEDAARDFLFNQLLISIKEELGFHPAIAFLPDNDLTRKKFIRCFAVFIFRVRKVVHRVQPDTHDFLAEMAADIIIQADIAARSGAARKHPPQ